ncbi:MAG: DUF4238 domain-containing protein [Bacteroidetes bacterium]|nr:DUF4238 domain-containing protein [Bacteroidota bacterium]
MSYHEIQGQHRLSQIYLKQFGYKKEEKWWVSVCKLGNKTTENLLIENFTKETNIFDLPFDNFKLKRHFENTSSILENRYQTVILNLKNQKRLTTVDRELLCNFDPNLLCRTLPFRMFIDGLLRTEDTRDKLLNEITLLKGNNQETKSILSQLKIDHQLNVVIGILMNHMVKVLSNFRQVVIKAEENKGWLTTDNPVYLDRQGHFEWIIPIESEIYFPLSKDYCLFMYHEKSSIRNNPFRKLEQDKIHNIDSDIFDNLTNKIILNMREYLIMPIELKNTDVTENKNGF